MTALHWLGLLVVAAATAFVVLCVWLGAQVDYRLYGWRFLQNGYWAPLIGATVFMVVWVVAEVVR